MGADPFIGIWKPTQEQFEAFLKREVEMCCHEIRRNPSLKQSMTLFSARTWQRAQEETSASLKPRCAGALVG